MLASEDVGDVENVVGEAGVGGYGPEGECDNNLIGLALSCILNILCLQKCVK